MTGGWAGSYLSSTEVHTVGTSIWEETVSLPSLREHPRGFTIFNQFYITGELGHCIVKLSDQLFLIYIQVDATMTAAIGAISQMCSGTMRTHISG